MIIIIIITMTMMMMMMMMSRRRKKVRMKIYHHYRHHHHHYCHLLSQTWQRVVYFHLENHSPLHLNTLEATFFSARVDFLCRVLNVYVGTRVNKTEETYRRSRVNVKVEPRSTLRLRVTFDTLPLLYLRAYPRKNYATVEIHL